MAAAFEEENEDEIPTSRTRILPEFSACPIPVPLEQYEIALHFILMNIIKKFKEVLCFHINEEFFERDSWTAGSLYGYGFRINVNSPTSATIFKPRYKTRKIKSPCNLHAFEFGIYNPDFTKSASHAVLGIYNRKTNVLEIYDPNIFEYVYINSGTIKAIKEIIEFVTDFDLSRTFTKPLVLRVQSPIKSSRIFGSDTKYTEPGYCSAWILWLLYVRLIYPDRDIKDVIKDAKEEFTDLGTQEIIRGFIREGVKLWKEMKLEFKGTDSERNLSDSQKRQLTDLWIQTIADVSDIEVPYLDNPVEINLDTLIGDSDVDEYKLIEIISEITDKERLKHLLYLSIKAMKNGLILHLIDTLNLEHVFDVITEQYFKVEELTNFIDLLISSKLTEKRWFALSISSSLIYEKYEISIDLMKLMNKLETEDISREIKESIFHHILHYGHKNAELIEKLKSIYSP